MDKKQEILIKDYNKELQQMNKLLHNTTNPLDRNRALSESLDRLKKIINRLSMSATSGYDDSTRNLLVDDYFERLRVLQELYFDSINHSERNKSKEEVDSLLYLLRLGVDTSASSSSASSV